MTAEPCTVDRFISCLDSAIAPMLWEHSASTDSQHFLDLQVSLVRKENNTVGFSFSMFRKPNFRAHYLSGLSNHPNSHKKSIFKCECNRALVCSSESVGYDSSISDITRYLADCGYPTLVGPEFDEQHRQNILAKLRLRSKPQGQNGKRGFDDKVFIVMPFSPCVKHLGIQSCFRKHLSFTNLELTLAWTVKPNSMRLLYRLNWPYEHRMH